MFASVTDFEKCRGRRCSGIDPSAHTAQRPEAVPATLEHALGLVVIHRWVLHLDRLEGVAHRNQSWIVAVAKHMLDVDEAAGLHAVESAGNDVLKRNSDTNACTDSVDCNRCLCMSSLFLS